MFSNSIGEDSKLNSHGNEVSTTRGASDDDTVGIDISSCDGAIVTDSGARVTGSGRTCFGMNSSLGMVEDEVLDSIGMLGGGSEETGGGDGLKRMHLTWSASMQGYCG